VLKWVSVGALEEGFGSSERFVPPLNEKLPQTRVIAFPPLHIYSPKLFLLVPNFAVPCLAEVRNPESIMVIFAMFNHPISL